MDRIIEINVKDKGILDMNTKSFGIPLVYNINDLKTIGSRRSSFSKTIKIIGSKNNNEIFNNLYEIRGMNFNYKFRNKYDCSLMVNRVPIFDGFIQLKKITKVLINSTYEIVYEVNLFDNVKNLFDDLNQLNLSDLDFSNDFEYDGIFYQQADKSGGFDKDEVGNTYKTLRGLQDVVVYPTVDYGFNEGISGSFPYRRTISTGLLYPSVYLKAILDNIFYNSDFDYVSDFLSGDSYDGMYKEILSIYNKKNEFTNLMLCSGNGTIQVSAPVNMGEPLLVPLSNSGMLVYESENHLSFDISDNIKESDINKDVDSIIIKEDGIYNIDVLLYVDNDLSGGVGPNPSDDFRSVYGIDVIENKTIENDDGTTGITQLSTTIWEYRLPDLIYSIDSYWETVENIELETGQVLKVYIKPGGFYYNSSNVVPAVPLLRYNISLTYKKEQLIDDTGNDIINPIIVNEIIPSMQQGEFLRNHIKLFNLYLYNDPYDIKKINIEPRDYFYEQGTTISWTDKVDYHRDIVVESTIDDLSSVISFTHLLGDEFYSQEYNDTNNLIYGKKEVDVEGYLSSELDETQTSFQSYLQKNGDFLISKLNKDFDSTWYDEKIGYSPMIGFINTMATQNDFLMGDYINEDGTFYDGWYNYYVNYLVFSTHSKVIGGNSYDLNYQTTGHTFTQVGYDVDRGLYKVFWEKYMNNLIDVDARKVILYVDLKIEDMINLDFRNKIEIEGQVYILEKLEYDPSNDESSKITLIKEILNEPGSYSPDSFMLLNNSGDFITTSDNDDKIII